ncbi:MAG TPA: mannitol dehydrogenase family protein [Paracoccus solventivorans]|uniref:Mannitol dehydrogenase family protein n=1 Tax=Paracoccus solventivorans TaxID=53463 RepID=A0A832PL22_9RHOB|nr:mannitol dehydrogenase family protein [Paracoccus solventivorans]HHW33529.1 mannitol dehydrogenase family protein [Paracoccus solventivorans]
MSPLLTRLTDLPPGVARPGYDRAAHGFGILHLGLGAFHRAHQAVYTDDALAAEGGDWRILGANLRSRDIAQALNAQDGLYTVLERGPQDRARVIGAHGPAIGGDPAAILRAACDPAIRILSLTVSEKAYGIDRAAMDADPAHPAVAHDLAQPQAPQGVLGIITAALAARLAARVAPFTVLCCDNLPDNGVLLRAGVLGFARRRDPDLAARIADLVAFPATMVDRITPAVTPQTLADVQALTDHRDLACVETEPFSQWVIEDHFPQGRPAWEAGGAQLVADVRAHEAMKLRMLNGAHSLIAYAGQLLGLPHVRDAVADPDLAPLIRCHMQAAGATLPRGAGLDPEAYAQALMARFANPAIAHQTRQIAMDGTEKLPQRWFAPAAEALAAGADPRPFALATAVWLAWLAQLAARNETPDDPRGAALLDLAQRAGADDGALVASVLALPGLAPAALTGHRGFIDTTRDLLGTIRRGGLRAALAAEPR